MPVTGGVEVVRGGQLGTNPARQSPGLKDSVGDRSNNSNLWTTRIRLKSCQNSGNLIGNHQKMLKFQENSTFSKVFCEIPRKFHPNRCKIWWNLLKNSNFLQILIEKNEKVWQFFLGFSVPRGAKVWESCRSRKMLKNETLIAKIGVDTEENEPSKVWSFGWGIGERFGIESFN